MDSTSSAYTLNESLTIAKIGMEKVDCKTGQILDVNEYWARLHGYSVEDYCSLTLYDLQPRLTPQAFKNSISGIRTSGVHKDQNVHLTVEGREIYFSVQGHIIPASDRYPEHTIMFFTDMTERVNQERLAKLAAEERDIKNEILSLSCDIAGSAVAELDVDSNQLRLIAGNFPNKSLLDESILTLQKLASKVFSDTPFETIKAMQVNNGTTAVLKGVYSDDPKQHYWVRVVFSEVYKRDGKRFQALCVQDVSEAERALIETQRLNRELVEREEKQSQIFAIIGHELRTPLASIKMMQEAMELRNFGELAENICESTDVLLNIVDDLRTVFNPDRANDARLVVESPFNVLKRTIRSLEGLYEQRGVKVIVTSSQLAHSLCRFNAQAFRQKAANLTKNAAIHAEADTIWVDLQAHSRSDDKIDLTLIVEDNGKGIPEGLREDVFGVFSRGDTRADGTGLGLYITRELAEKLGGTVEYFESKKGGAGFKVDFALDMHLDTDEHKQAEEEIPEALLGKRILYAEDQKTLQLLTSNLLKGAGAEVVVCDNGKQALDAFRAGEFDIVLTDLMMPAMSGDELIRHIRADGFTGQVVALTAAIIGKETEQLTEAGADAVLTKPLDIHILKQSIAGLAIKDSVA